MSQEAIANAHREAALDIFMRSRQWPEEGSPEFEMRTWQRLLLTEEQKDFGIQVSTEAAAAAARSVLASLSRSEQGPVSFDDFVGKALNRRDSTRMILTGFFTINWPTNNCSRWLP